MHIWRNRNWVWGLIKHPVRLFLYAHKQCVAVTGNRKAGDFYIRIEQAPLGPHKMKLIVTSTDLYSPTKYGEYCFTYWGRGLRWIVNPHAHYMAKVITKENAKKLAKKLAKKIDQPVILVGTHAMKGRVSLRDIDIMILRRMNEKEHVYLQGYYSSLIDCFVDIFYIGRGVVFRGKERKWGFFPDGKVDKSAVRVECRGDEWERRGWILLEP